MRQGKTGLPVVLHVPEPLAEAIARQAGRHPTRIFATPRGRAWTLGNAQETLARLLAQLGLDRYTLHGLRATGPTELERAGMERRPIRELTGHTSDRNFEVYVRGAGGFGARQKAAEWLAGMFEGVVAGDETERNRRRFSGVTGRASKKERVE
jgi:integrase